MPSARHKGGLQLLRESKAKSPGLLVGYYAGGQEGLAHDHKSRKAKALQFVPDVKLAEHRLVGGPPEDVRRSFARLPCSCAESSACRAASASPSLLRSRCSAAQPFHARRGRQAALICRAGRPRQGQQHGLRAGLTSLLMTTGAAEQHRWGAALQAHIN